MSYDQIIAIGLAIFMLLLGISSVIVALDGKKGGKK